MGQLLSTGDQGGRDEYDKQRSESTDGWGGERLVAGSDTAASGLIGGCTAVPNTIMPWIVDIASVAQAHINALENKDANGRYIIANAPLDFQQVCISM